MTKTEYAAYLQSDHWREFRTKSIESWPYCVRCEMPRWLAVIAYDQDLHVHHKNYRSRGRETINDVENLCRRCHEVETFGRSDLRAPKTAICESCEAVHWNPYSDLCGECALLNGIGHGPWLGALLQSPQYTLPGRGRALWKGVLRSICRVLCDGPRDTGVPEVAEELKAIHSEIVAQNEKWFARCKNTAEIPF